MTNRTSVPRNRSQGLIDRTRLVTHMIFIGVNVGPRANALSRRCYYQSLSKHQSNELCWTQWHVDIVRKASAHKTFGERAVVHCANANAMRETRSHQTSTLRIAQCRTHAQAVAKVSKVSKATCNTYLLLVLHRYCIGYRYIGYIGQKYWYRLSAILQNVNW